MTKRTTVTVMMLLAVLSVAPIAAQRKVAELEVTLDKDRYVLNEMVSGTVVNLAPGENFTLELTDGYGRAVLSKKLRRVGARPTKFSFRIDFNPTICYTVNVVTTKKRKASTGLLVSPTDFIWDDFPLILWTDSSNRGTMFFEAARLLGLNAGFVGPTGKADKLLQNNFRCIISRALGETPFNTSDDRQAGQPDEADKGKVPGGPVRKPCLSDTDVHAAWTKSFDKMIDEQKDYLPVGYSVGDNLSLTVGTDAIDYCFDPRSLEAFRQTLQGSYGNIGVLNRTWGTKFRNWRDVVPMTAAQTIKTQFGQPPLRRKPYNFASWYDHREFMDNVFAGTLRNFVTHAHQMGRQLRMDVPVGMTGAFEPAAYGGYDWSELINVFDWLECPDYFGSKRLVNALNRRRRQPAVTLTVINDAGKPEKATQNLWRDILLGDRGAIVRPGSSFIDGQDRLTEFAYGIAWQLKTIRDGLGRLFVQPGMAPADDGVAIYYSHPSVRVQWMLDAGSRAQNEPEFVGTNMDLSFTDADSTEIATRMGWMELLDDLHIGYTFLSHRELLSDARVLSGVSVLVLPKTVCMSSEEVLRMSNWVRAGGTIIADSQSAIFDMHARQLKNGRLDSLFGISRTGIETGELAGKSRSITKMPLRMRATGNLKGLIDGLTTAGLVPVEPGVDAKGARALLQSGHVKGIFIRRVGKGNAVYLNLSLLTYHRNRADASKSAPLRKLIRRVLAHAGVTAKVTVEHVGGPGGPSGPLDVFRNSFGPLELVALMRRPAVVEPTMPPPAMPDPEKEPLPPDQAPRPELEPAAEEKVVEAPPVDEKADEKELDEKKKDDDEEKPDHPPAQRAKVSFARKCHAYDVLRRVYLGHREQVEVSIPENTPTLIACLPYEVSELVAKVSLNDRRLKYQFSIKTLPGGRTGTHVFRVEVRDPKDHRSLKHSFNLTARAGYATGTMNFVVGDAKGVWTLIVTDVISGKSAETTVELKEKP